MNCCGQKMKRIDLLTHWCGNCGAIRTLWWCRGRVVPNLDVCATCVYWGPDGRGAALRCHWDESKKHWCSSSITCPHHLPRNPATGAAIDRGRRRDLKSRVAKMGDEMAAPHKCTDVRPRTCVDDRTGRSYEAVECVECGRLHDAALWRIAARAEEGKRK